jgi:hypothetical protein
MMPLKLFDKFEQVRLSSTEVLMARTDGIRLRWYAGYVSEYPDPLDDDTQEVTLDADKGIVTLHAKTGSISWIDRVAPLIVA